MSRYLVGSFAGDIKVVCLQIGPPIGVVGCAIVQRIAFVLIDAQITGTGITVGSVYLYGQ